MARKVICQKCRQLFDRSQEEFEKNSKGYYHKKCFEELGAQKQTSERKQMLDLLESWAPKKNNYPLIQKQLKQYIEEFGYTDSGLLGTLLYVHKVKGIKFDAKRGVAILPYFYNEARQYYQKLATIGEEKADITETTIYIHQPKSHKLDNLIDIESLLEGS